MHMPVVQVEPERDGRSPSVPLELPCCMDPTALRVARVTTFTQSLEERQPRCVCACVHVVWCMSLLVCIAWHMHLLACGCWVCGCVCDNV